MGMPVISQNIQQNEAYVDDAQLEQVRKKVKRVTGELEVLETYFHSF